MQSVAGTSAGFLFLAPPASASEASSTTVRTAIAQMQWPPIDGPTERSVGRSVARVNHTHAKLAGVTDDRMYL